MSELSSVTLYRDHPRDHPRDHVPSAALRDGSLVHNQPAGQGIESCAPKNKTLIGLCVRTVGSPAIRSHL